MPEVGPKWNIFCLFMELNLKISFNLCARVCFNVIWLVKSMKIRKLIIEIMSI